jgi:hypothetical protein
MGSYQAIVQGAREPVQESGEAPLAKAPVTKAPETKAPETKAPVTKAPVTKAGAPPPRGSIAGPPTKKAPATKAGNNAPPAKKEGAAASPAKPTLTPKPPEGAPPQTVVVENEMQYLRFPAIIAHI